MLRSKNADHEPGSTDEGRDEDFVPSVPYGFPFAVWPVVGIGVLVAVFFVRSCPDSGAARRQSVSRAEQTVNAAIEAHREKTVGTGGDGPAGSGPSGTLAAASGDDVCARANDRIEDTPLSDLMTLFHASKRSGLLAVCMGGTVGRIFLVEGKAVDAVRDGVPNETALQAYEAIVCSTEGRFVTDWSHDTQTQPVRITDPLGLHMRAAACWMERSGSL